MTAVFFTDLNIQNNVNLERLIKTFWLGENWGQESPNRIFMNVQSYAQTLSIFHDIEEVQVESFR